MGTERTKEELKAAADALFADIDAEFGKKTKKVAAPKPAKKLLPNEGQEANRIVELLSARSEWKPVAVVNHLVIQNCKCCGSETEYVGGKLIRHRHKTRGYTWDNNVPVDPSHAYLPHVVESLNMDVEECASCIRMNLYVVSADLRAVQYPLF